MKPVTFRFRMLIVVMPLVLFSMVVRGQTELDSLWSAWNDRSIEDSSRLEAISLFAKRKFLRTDPDSAFVLYQMASDFAKSVGEQKWVAESEHGLGNCMYFLGNYDEAVKHYERSISIRKELGMIEGQARSYNNLAIIYSRLGNYPKAINYYLNVLRTRESLGDSLNIYGVYNNLGMLYLEQQDYPMALKNFSIAKDLNERYQNIEGIANSFGNLGIVYSNLGDFTMSDSMFRASIALKIELGDSVTIAGGLMDVGSNWFKQGQLDSALHYFTEALGVMERVNLGIKKSSAYTNIGTVHFVQGNLEQAEYYGKKGLEEAQDLGLLRIVAEASNLLYKVYSKQGKDAIALKMFELSVATKDSLNKEENQREVIRQQYQYDLDKQSLADSLEFAKKEAVLEEQAEKQQIGLLAAGGGLLLLMALAFTIYSGKKKSDELLLNILPEEVAYELKKKGHADAKLIDLVTVLFTDFKGFTTLSEQLSPKELVEDLNECFSAFDNICEKYGIEKIKTIGDAYMAAGGLPSPNTTHAQDVVKAALEMAQVIEKGKAKKIEKGLPYFEIRIGVHTGPVVAGIVGVKKFQYDIWGDTVNTASRMESSGEVGKVNISETTYELVKEQFSCEYRGEVEAKGKGKLKMYFVS